ncbi:MAG: DUF1566 domain-containing protein [Rikenellaceae bacterium]
MRVSFVSLCFSFVVLFVSCTSRAQSYPQISTGQSICYDLDGVAIDRSVQCDLLYGQDADYGCGASMSFRDNGDGTVTDLNTGLMWQQTPLSGGATWSGAQDYCLELDLAGYSDWRLPTAKELFSISDMGEGWPYIDTAYFHLARGITKDEQYWSSNKYVGETVEGGFNAAFGVNHVTGHIKAYSASDSMSPRGGQGEPRVQGEQGRPQGGGQHPPQMAGHGRPIGQGGQRPPQMGGDGRPQMANRLAKQVRAVRGSVYGENDFVDNGDGTISDRATGLMWSKDDSGSEGMTWVDALVYAQKSELAGYTDWRLPNVKELQAIVDYSSAPSSKSANTPAISPVFSCSAIVNENNDSDFGYYWSSTSARFTSGQPMYFAWYVAFGRAVNDRGLDYHGAGAVRFDSKSNDGRKVEGGEERYYNIVRLVRSDKSE